MLASFKVIGTYRGGAGIQLYLVILAVVTESHNGSRFFLAKGKAILNRTGA